LSDALEKSIQVKYGSAAIHLRKCPTTQIKAYYASAPDCNGETKDSAIQPLVVKSKRLYTGIVECLRGSFTHKWSFLSIVQGD